MDDNKVINLAEAKKGFRKSKALNKREQIQMLEERVALLEVILQDLASELQHNHSNGVAMFRALEKKGHLTEDDIKESWQENVIKPMEEAVNAQKNNDQNDQATPVDEIPDTEK